MNFVTLCIFLFSIGLIGTVLADVGRHQKPQVGQEKYQKRQSDVLLIINAEEQYAATRQALAITGGCIFVGFACGLVLDYSSKESRPVCLDWLRPFFDMIKRNQPSYTIICVWFGALAAGFILEGIKYKRASRCLSSIGYN
jgi:uncharacterized protein YbdZ (MbtH family)